MKRRLFAHERELQSWRSLTLTTQRVIHRAVRHGFESSTSIPLQHVQWTRIARSHQPSLIILAGLLAALCIYALGEGSKEAGAILLVLAGVLAIAYLRTRHVVLELASGGGRIELVIDADEPSRQQARDFVDAVEDAAGRSLPLLQGSVTA